VGHVAHIARSSMTGAPASPTPHRGHHWSFDNLHEILTGRGPVRPGGRDQFTALCPVHEDSTPSLSVTWKHGHAGGVTLVNCFACSATAQDVVDALGLTLADLYDEPLERTQQRTTPRIGRSPQQRTAGPRRGKLGRLPALLGLTPAPQVAHTWDAVQTYPYVDAGGTLVQEVLREQCSACPEPHKRFRQVFLTERGTRVKTKPEGFAPVLYRMPQVLAAVAAGTPVWLVEGEKDVETAERLGLAATTNTQGADSFPPQLAEVFGGATVHVVLDRDQAGYERGVSLHQQLTAVHANVVLLLPATPARKSDLTDHVDDGHWKSTETYGGLQVVGVQELAAHAVLATITTKGAGVEQALEQAQLHLDAAEAVVVRERRTEHQQAAKRWAVEAERRYEVITDRIEEVRNHSTLGGSDWAVLAVTEAEEVMRRAGVAARTVHQITGMAVPPLLQEPLAATGGGEDIPLPDGPSEDPGSEQNGWSGERGETRSGLDIEQPVYRILDGQLVHRTITKDGEEVLKLVLGIDARVVEMEYLEAADNTLDVDAPVLQGREGIVGQAEANPPAPEVLSAVVIAFTHPATGEVMRSRIPADEYRDCTWVDSLPGPPAYDSTPRGIAKLRDALRAVGGQRIARTVRYRSTGWRRDEDGGWFYVHAGGAITSSGAKAAPVMLTGALRRFDLPAPCDDATRLREVFYAHSASMLHRLPERIGAPLLGHIFRSALGPNPWVLTLVGSPGSYKTATASLAMHHWGELWDRKKPATSMSGNGGTLNAIRVQLSNAKDAMYWADDAAPTKDWAAAQKTIEEFARLVHNGEERARSARDGLSVLDGTPPRSSAIITSEVMPRPGSGAERMLVVPLQQSEIDLEDLKWLDQGDSRFGRAQLMASFLQWLAGDLEQRRKEAFAEAERYADGLRAQGQGVRQSEAVGHTWAGWTAVTSFLCDVEAITAEERAELLAQVHEGLTGTVVAATDPDLPITTGARVRELLAHALRSGLAYVDDVRDGGTPPWPLAGRLGWRRVSMGADYSTGTERYRFDAKGIRFGYVLHDPDGTERVAQLIVDPTGLDQVLKAVGSTMSDAPQLDRGTAMRALYDEGVLIAEKNGTHTPRLMVKRTLHCEGRGEVRMVALRLHELLGDPPEDEQELSDAGPGTDGGPAGDAATPEDTAKQATEAGPTPTIPGVDDSQRASVVSSEPDPGLTSPPIDEEPPVAQTYFDLDGVAAEPEMFSPSEPCEACGQPCGIRMAGYVLHIPCWESSGAEQGETKQEETEPDPASAPVAAPVAVRPTVVEATAVEATAVEATAVEATEPRVPNSAVATTATPPVTRGSAPRRPAAAPASVFTAPAGVLHTDGVWLADGTRRDLPTPLTHVGHLAELVYELDLGVQVTPFWEAPGQIWVTPEMLAHLGVNPTGLGDDPGQFTTRLRELTAGSELVTEALQDGWSLGGKDGDRLGTWTRVFREGGKRGVWVVLVAGMSRDGMDTPVLADDPDPATLARRLALFSSALQAPWVMNGFTTGLELAFKLRGKDRKNVFAASEPVPPAQISTENDVAWSRRPTEAESRKLYVHAYDRGGSYAAGVAGLELGIGAPTHHPEGCTFDKKLPGYWRVEVTDTGDWRMPHPLNPRGRVGSQPVWVTTPTLQLAVEMGHEPPVLEAYTWAEHGRILDGWYARVRDARTALDTDDVDAQAARNQLKVVYTRTIGAFGSETFMRGREGYAPERRHHIVAKARSNMLRRIAQIGRDTDQWPVAVVTDTVLYVSDEPDPVAAWPGDPKHLGRGFGQFKAEASGLLVEQLPHLTGDGYRGKQHLGAPGSALAAGSGEATA
jgi:hypothetical protein